TLRVHSPPSEAGRAGGSTRSGERRRAPESAPRGRRCRGRPGRSGVAGCRPGRGGRSPSSERRTTMADTVARQDADGVATSTLLQPGLTSALRRELLDVVTEVAADESVRAVLLTGSGRAFCVGQDLAEHVASLRGDAESSLTIVADEYNPLILALSGLRV